MKFSIKNMNPSESNQNKIFLLFPRVVQTDKWKSIWVVLVWVQILVFIYLVNTDQSCFVCFFFILKLFILIGG